MYMKYLRASGPVLLVYLLFVMLTEGCVLAGNIWLQIWSDNGDNVLLHQNNTSDDSLTVEEGLTGYGLIGLVQCKRHFMFFLLKNNIFTNKMLF